MPRSLPRILIVEGEEQISLLLQYNLEAAGYEVLACGGGEEAERLVEERSPDLVLLDAVPTGGCDAGLYRRIRERPRPAPLPVIMLTGSDGMANGACGPELGADDYIVKPFSVPELLTRVSSTLRRANPLALEGRLAFADIELDRETHRVTRSGRLVHLGPIEFRLLEFLLRAPGRVFSRGEILREVWALNVHVDERTVDVHIGRLRKALCRGGRRDPVRTVRGSGYALNDGAERRRRGPRPGAFGPVR